MVAEERLFFLCDLYFCRSVLRIFPVAVPGRSYARRSGLASCRPLPLARLPFSAPGGGRLAPPTSYARRSHNPAVAQGLLCKPEKRKITIRLDGHFSFLASCTEKDIVHILYNYRFPGEWN